MVVVIFWNVAGFLMTVAAGVLGLLALLFSGLFSVAIAASSVVLIAGGLLWRHNGPRRNDGSKAAWPSVFFVPTPIWGAVLLVIGGTLGLGIDVIGRMQEHDPRRQSLRADEALLRGQTLAGDTTAAAAVQMAVLNSAYSGDTPRDVSVFVGVKADAVLVIVKITNLSQFDGSARKQVLDAVGSALDGLPSFAGMRRYIGVKGSLIFGAASSPTRRETGGSPAGVLLEYYDHNGAAPASVSRDRSPTRAAPARATVVVHIPTAAKTPGFDEMKKYNSLRGELAQTIDLAGAGKLERQEWGDGECLMICSGTDADALWNAILPVLEKTPLPKGSHMIRRKGGAPEERVDIRSGG